MAAWTWSLTLPEEGPLALRVERAVVAAIRAGQLGAGDRLPSTRALAESLGVSRNTAVAAYRELVAQGWITARPSRSVAMTPSPRMSRAAPKFGSVCGVGSEPEWYARLSTEIS